MVKQKVKILMVDNREENFQLVEHMLLPLGYQVILARDGEDVLKKAREDSPNIILLDMLTSKMGNFEVTRKLKEDEVTKTMPLVMITKSRGTEDQAKALEAGADDFLIEPIDNTELRAKLNCLLKVNACYDHMRNFQEKVEAEVAKRTESLAQAVEKTKIASLDTVYRLSRAAEYKDEDTGAHVERMSHYSSAIARKMGFNEAFVEQILWASPMHDIGKIGIPERILQKPGKLDEEEMNIMRQHTIIGAKILKGANADFIKLAEIISLNHHEKWNGSGYPNGVKGSDIPLAARIVAVADVFDALTSERPYKKPFPLEKALAIINEGRGIHFDPDIVDTFCASKEEISAELNWWKFLQSDSDSSGPDLSNLFSE